MTWHRFELIPAAGDPALPCVDTDDEVMAALAAHPAPWRAVVVEYNLESTLYGEHLWPEEAARTNGASWMDAHARALVMAARGGGSISTQTH